MTQENPSLPDPLKSPGSWVNGLSAWPLGLVLGVAVATTTAWRSDWLPWVVLLGWLRAPGALWRARGVVSGTELRGALIWAWLVFGLGVFTQVVASGEPIAAGRPWAGHLCYLTTLSALAGLISVLNARTPGGGAWAILMGLLVLVLLIPWLEGPGFLRGGASPLGRLRLESPWDLFFGLLVLAGVTNFLPTRFGRAAAWLLAAFVLQYLGLSGRIEAREMRGLIWSVIPWAISEAYPAAVRGEARPNPGVSRLERLWFWFRDHWGVVWGLRVLERFNKTAEAQGWGVRLAWHGLVGPNGVGTPDEAADGAALVLLKGLIRRFAVSGRLDQAAESGR